MTLAFSDTLAELHRQFAAQLPARVDAINTLARSLEPAAWNPSDAEALHRLVQNLTNSAGIFGIPSVSEVARTLEARLAALLKAGAAPTQTEWQALCTDLDRMERLARMESAMPKHAADPDALAAHR
jgi:chemotaxis protein histidine kinase CheA